MQMLLLQIERIRSGTDTLPTLSSQYVPTSCRHQGCPQPLIKEDFDLHAYVLTTAGKTPQPQVRLWQPSGSLHSAQSDNLLIPSQYETAYSSGSVGLSGSKLACQQPSGQLVI